MGPFCKEILIWFQWLTTGRNSCPLCRGQGVDEKRESQPETSARMAEAI